MSANDTSGLERPCINCKHHRGMNNIHRCHHPDIAQVDPVTGVYVPLSCYDARQTRGFGIPPLCEDGKLWEFVDDEV